MSLTSYRAAPPRVKFTVRKIAGEDPVLEASVDPREVAGTYSRFAGDVKGARDEICRVAPTCGSYGEGRDFMNQGRGFRANREQPWSGRRQMVSDAESYVVLPYSRHRRRRSHAPTTCRRPEGEVLHLPNS